MVVVVREVVVVVREVVVVTVRGAKQGTCRFKLPHEKSCVWEPVVSAEVSLLALANILESLPSKNSSVICWNAYAS